jgi:hypothetical protein
MLARIDRFEIGRIVIERIVVFVMNVHTGRNRAEIVDVNLAM